MFKQSEFLITRELLSQNLDELYLSKPKQTAAVNLSECNQGDIVFFPKTYLAPSDVDFPFIQKRHNFPSFPRRNND